MWDDIYNENFVDTLLLLSIPGISIGLTIIVAVVNFLVKRHRQRSRQKTDFQRMSAALEEAEEEDDRRTRVRFGIQQSVSADLNLKAGELERQQHKDKKKKKKEKNKK